MTPLDPAIRAEGKRLVTQALADEWGLDTTTVAIRNDAEIAVDAVADLIFQAGQTEIREKVEQARTSLEAMERTQADEFGNFVTDKDGISGEYKEGKADGCGYAGRLLAAALSSSSDRGRDE